MEIKKGDYIKNKDIEGVAFSFSKSKKSFYVIDGNNNVMELANDKYLQKETLEDLNFDNFLYVIIGLEDERYRHLDKYSYENALTWEINKDGTNILNKIQKVLNKPEYNSNYKDILNIFINCEKKIVIDIGFEIITNIKLK